MTISRNITKLLFPLLLTCLMGCGSGDAPDVSGISVNINIRHFEKFLFEELDTSDAVHTITQLESAYPGFASVFLVNILGLPRLDSSSPESNTLYTFSELKRFLELTRPLYDSLSPKFEETAKLQSQLVTAFKYVKYYYPDYKVPAIITFVGPFNAPGVAVTNNALAIGLQLYAGKDFSYYTSDQGQELFPRYISRNFEPVHIPVNCMKAVAEDIYPDNSRGRPLIEQMIEKGKQWYLAGKFLPGYPDSLKTGYTQQQLIWCEQNEGLIWNFLLQGNDIYTTEPAFIKDYIGEAPTTTGMPEASPGNIGQWIGWRIINKYAAKNPDLKLDELMQTDAKKIFSAAKYKPR